MHWLRFRTVARVPPFPWYVGSRTIVRVASRVYIGPTRTADNIFNYPAPRAGAPNSPPPMTAPPRSNLDAYRSDHSDRHSIGDTRAGSTNRLLPLASFQTHGVMSREHPLSECLVFRVGWLSDVSRRNAPGYDCLFYLRSCRLSFHTRWTGFYCFRVGRLEE